MNFKDALSILAPQVPTRGEQQLVIEKAITNFNSDAIEATELLDALIAALDNRYDRDALGDVRLEFLELREALEELDRTMTDADVKESIQESHYENWKARRDEE